MAAQVFPHRGVAPPDPPSQDVTPFEHRIAVTQAREDVPEFKRTYTSQLPGRVVIEITMCSRSYLQERHAYGVLTQPNGRYIHFDPRAVADKILDPTLVPSVVRCVREIFAHDNDFMRTRPNRFVDERGQTWVRLSQGHADLAPPLGADASGSLTRLLDDNAEAGA